MGVTFNPLEGQFDIIKDKASEISIVDSGTYYTGTEVETALQEIGSDIAGLGSTYVPYTGASSDVDLGAYDLEATELRVKGTIDHTITDSSDDLVVTNPNEDKSIFFNLNRGGTTGNLVQMDGNLGLFKVSAFGGIYGVNGLFNIGGSMGMTSITGMVGMNPTLTSNGILVANLVQPTHTTGTSITHIAFYMNPLPTGTSPLNLETIRTVAANHRVGVNDTIKIIAEQGFNRSFFAFGADDTSVNTYRQVTLGGVASIGDFGGFTAATYTEEMITLNGGATRPFGTTSSITQKGLWFKGFGTQTGLISGTDSCYALLADGGTFSFKFDYSANNNALLFGAGEDAGIGYDGADFVIDPQLVGTGSLKLANGGIIAPPDEITATSAGVAASITTLNTEVTTNGDSDLDNVTLANGVSGQIKHIYCVVEGNAADTWKITPATMCGGTQITFSGVGEGCTLIYADNEGWVVTANNGGTIT